MKTPSLARSASRALREERQALIELLPAAICLCDAEGRVTMFNRAAAELWGREPELGRDLWCGSWKIYTPEGKLLPHEECPMAVAVRERRAIVGTEMLIERMNGERRHVRAHPHPMFSAFGELTGAINLLVDITADRRASEALRESEERFRLMADAAPVNIWTSGPDGRLTWCNRSWLEFVGRRMTEETGDGWTDHLHPEDRDLVMGAYRAALASRQPFSTEYRLRRDDGDVRWLLDHGSPIYAGDAFTGYVGSRVDITDRRRAEEALKRSEERLRLATAAGRVGVWDWDVRADTVRWSDTLYSIHGVTPASFGGTVEAFVELVHPEDRARVRRAVEAALEDGAPYEIEFRVLRPDGRIVCIYTNAHVVRDAEGAPIRMLGATVDITDRKEAESALQERFRQLETIYRLSSAVAHAAELDDIFEAALDGLIEAVHADGASILLFDDGDVMRFKGWRGLSETYRRAVEGHSPWERTDAEARPLTIPDAREAEELGELAATIEREGVRGMAFIPLASAGQLLGKFMVYYDGPHAFTDEEIQLCQTIADHVAYAIERAHTARALRESARRKDEFLATLAHELRNPLAPLQNALEVFKEEGHRSPHHLVVAREAMVRQVKHMVRLIEDLLDVSRISRGHIQLRMEEVLLSRVVNDAVEDLRPLVEGKGQRLAVTLPDRALHLRADPVRLAQIVGNLLHNACKYTGEGGDIRLTVGSGTEEALIRVQDTGAGIASSELPRVFDLFSQFERPRLRGQGGLGIGLALVKSLVGLHGGTVEALSEGPDRGSEFLVRLPLLPDPGEVEADDPAEARGRDPERRRVLVVDDNRDAAETLSMVLQLHGHDVRTVFDGARAVEAAAEFSPDAILLDIGLPKMDGYEAARLIREQAGDRRVLLIAVTGWSQERDRRRSEEAGFDHHLVKPVDFAELAELLRASLADPSPRDG